MKTTLEILVKKANSGDQKALDTIVMNIKDLIYNLSLKMLLLPEDAEDATQEILVKIITHLSTFKQESQFNTWVYRVATNYLLTTKGKRSRNYTLPFSEYSDLIDRGHSNNIRYTQNQGELRLLEEEVKISCTHGLLLCLKERYRIVYILGEIIWYDSIEGGQILEVSPENFRKQLSRSRAKIRNFLQAKCGLINTNAPCRCHKKVDFLIDQKMINPKELKFATHSKRSLDLFKKIVHLEETTALYRAVPNEKAPQKVIENIRTIIQSI